MSTWRVRLSLSRLNHWLPRGQAHPDIVQRTAAFHDEIAATLLPQPHPVLHEATTLDTAVDVLDPQPTLMQPLVRHVLFPRELLTAEFLRGPKELHLGQREG